MSDTLPSSPHDIEIEKPIEEMQPTVPEKIELSKPVDTLIDRYVAWLLLPKKSLTPIHVDEIASKIAKLYELIRKVVDWKEDTVLRRSAIERILKRLIFGKMTGFAKATHVSADSIAETITMDLIRGGHLPNDTIPREIIPKLSVSINKYLSFISIQTLPITSTNVLTARHNFTTFIVELAACEIEDILTDPQLEYGLLDAMTSAMVARMKVSPEGILSEDDIQIQAYIGVARTLFDLDDSFIIYRLLCFQYPQYKNPDPELFALLNRDIVSIWTQSEVLLSFPQGKQFYAICEQMDTIFALIGDVLKEKSGDPKGIRVLFETPSKLKVEIENAYDIRYKTLKKRLFLLGIFSTLSVFASNWVTFFLVEVPAASIFGEGFSLFTTFIDFIVPTIAMFLLVSVIKPPGQSNRDNVVRTVIQFVTKDIPVSYYEIKMKRPQRPIVYAVLGILYTAIMIFMLGLIAWIFYIAGLPITSVIFDTATIAMTVFAAVIIRNKSKELTVGEKTSSVEFLMDMISVPIAKLGSLLAKTWKQYNVIAFFFTFLVETPFAIVIDMIEQWSQFIKERRSDIH